MIPAELPPEPLSMLRVEWLPFFALALGCSGDGRDPPRDTAAPSAGGRPRSDELSQERSRLVDQLAARGIRDARVLQAMRDVPRHWFVPDWVAGDAYQDDALPIGAGQTISQPYIVALMTEALDLTPEARVLEIGTGSGYQAAVLSELTPNVWTIEIVPELAERARAAFENHGYDTIRCRTGDGWVGWQEEAPFDAVIVTAAPEHIPSRLFEQLKVGGRMCIPVGATPADQRLLLVSKGADGSMSIEPLAPVRFVPMTGAGEPRR